MRKFATGSIAALSMMCFVPSSHAADPDHELGLIVSGVVDQWAGVQFSDINGTFSEDTWSLASGGEGKLSLPLGSNLSIQSDVKYETNEQALETPGPGIGLRYSYQGAVHLSWRNPETGLLGAFGGAGTANTDETDYTDAHFVGGEGQLYLNDMTFYAQAGYVDFNLRNFANGLDDGVFARGVIRWFLNDATRLQLEGMYLAADYTATEPGSMDAFAVKARYDFALSNIPLAGDVPLYVAYRGTFRDDCIRNEAHLNDHTVMVGTSYSFSGSLLNVDRHGATLDTPDFNHSCFSSLN